MPKTPEVTAPPNRVPILIAFILVLAGYLWAFTENGGFRPSKEPSGYYGLLTDALMSGQLNLKVEPDPRLALLANPWLSYQGIPRMHDATYFHGHYYLYFGVSPVILYFGPVRLLTGRFPTEGSAGVVFAFAGVMAGLWLLRRLMALQASPPGAGWQALGIVVWGFANYAFVDCQNTNFYTVPILCAFACLMAAMVSIERSLSAHRSSSATKWLALASLAWGLSVGSRPHYVLSLPLLGIPLAFLLARESGGWVTRGRLALVAAALIPAAIVGAGLAWYNHARFGSISEFGFRYQFTGSDNRFIQVWNPRLILPNLRVYSLTDAFYFAYFPFVVPIGLFIGFLSWCPISALSALLPASLLERRLRADPRWLCVAFCTAAAGAIHLFGLCILPIGVDRYNVDFLPEFLLAALFAAIAYFGTGSRWPRGARLLASVALVSMAAVSIAKLSLLALDRSPNAAQKRIVAQALNWPAAAAQSLSGGLKGPAVLDISFSSLPSGSREPLISTGIGNDNLFAEGVDQGHLRLGFVHMGNAPLYGPPFDAVPGGHRKMVADLGSFYPPDTHPRFRNWKQDVLDAMHRRVLVTLDGQTVLNGNSNFYPADPWSVRFCPPPADGMGFVPFSGTLEKVTRMPLPTESEIRETGWTGPVRLRLRFPRFEYAHSEPLLSTGSVQAVDMIYVTFLGPGRARFGHDSTQFGGVESPEVTYDPAVEHVLDIGLGSLEAAEGATPAAKLGLRLKFDGRWLVADWRPTHPTHPYQNLFGYNPGLGSASEIFSGSLVPEHIEPPMPNPATLPGKGPIEVTLRFAPISSGVPEPIVVSGVTGRGDIVFVRYLPGGQVQFGVDHWDIGLKQGKSFKLQEEMVHTVVVSSAAFLPAEDSPEWGSVAPAVREHLRSTIEVFFDGRKVLDAPWTGYDALETQVYSGTNPIGGSTTGAAFSGLVLSTRHCAMGDFLATVTKDSGTPAGPP